MDSSSNKFLLFVKFLFQSLNLENLLCILISTKDCCSQHTKRAQKGLYSKSVKKNFLFPKNVSKRTLHLHFYEFRINMIVECKL